jgi:hypothetical protein
VQDGRLVENPRVEDARRVVAWPTPPGARAENGGADDPA